MNEFPIDEIIFFTKNDDISDEIDNIIVAQNSSCCSRPNNRIEIDEDYIINELDNYTNGLVILGNGKIEDKDKRGFSKHMRAFTIFKYKCEIRDNGLFEGILRGIAICCDKDYKGYGKQLLERTKIIVTQNNIKRWIINSLPEPGLIEYYKKNGFIQVGEKSTKKGIVKTITMKIFFGEGEDDYNYLLEVDEDVCFEKPLNSIDDITLKEINEIKNNLYQI
jgi:N-acetylglutamate synthase-like GNAT family acetyltransferase